MSQAAVQAFIERINDDQTFRDGLIAAGDNDARLRIAQGAGFDVTADDLAALRREHGADELSEEDLQKIAGGMGDTTSVVLQSVEVLTVTAAAAAVAV